MGYVETLQRRNAAAAAQNGMVDIRGSGKRQKTTFHMSLTFTLSLQVYEAPSLAGNMERSGRGDLLATGTLTEHGIIFDRDQASTSAVA